MSASKWRRSGYVEITSAFDTALASFPISFLDTCGDNTWDYIAHVVNLLIEPDPDHLGEIVDSSGIAVDIQARPLAGKYRFREGGKTVDVTLSKGPEYFSTTVAPSGIEESTRSNSSYASRSRPDQAGFREELLIRDGACVLTDEVSSLVCDAAHIVPQSRPDVYSQLQGDAYGMFEASAGLLLQKTYHKSYDALKWSLYLKGETYYVHYFNPDNDTQRLLNGRSIPPERFRFLEKPDPRLVAWHYSQAVKMRIRGYSVGMIRRGRGRPRDALV